ncbi:MAG: cytochrome P450, partial [Anaerolineae bacterium]|nr:cytochrome P450 [Anaerolineae bacterium]
AGFAETMVACAERHLDPWRAGHHCDLHHELMRLTMTIVGQTLFGVDVTGQNEGLAQLLDELLGEFNLTEGTPWGQLLARLPTARQRHRRQLLHTLDETIFGFIQPARQRPAESLDLLAMLLAAQATDEGGGMSNQQLRDELITLFIAGHETTANALTWSFYLLSQHPAAEARLQAELAEVLAGRLPTLADVSHLKYSRMLFSEALRLYPPAWIIGRQAIGPDTIGGYPIPVGAPVFVSQWVMHRHPAYWERSTQFDPTRFDEDSPTYHKPPRYAYFPFGGGSRLCIGEQFAWLEGVLLIATLAQRFRVRLIAETPLPLQASITLRPAAGMPVVLLPH